MNEFDKQHLANISAYAQKLRGSFDRVINQASRLAENPHAEKFGKSFTFDSHPDISSRANVVFNDFQHEVVRLISSGVTNEWTLSNRKNDALVDSYLGALSKLKPEFKNPNTEALRSFANRQVKGMNLSSRVWNMVDGLRGELEIHCALGITNGDSAATISRRVRQYLERPDALFRRVRNEFGELEWSKRAKAYHPGQGTYRSAYKNAMRLTVTETNMAYREADYERWNQLDFVVGYEVKLSGSHAVRMPGGDICDVFQGKYPKKFKFTGWHPQCLCYAVPIMPKDAEWEEYENSILNGTDGDFKFREPVVSIPGKFTDWIDTNREKAKGWAEVPYFAKDNPGFVPNFKSKRDIRGKRLKTEQQKADIQNKWNDRLKTIKAKSKLDEVILKMEKAKVERLDVRLLEQELSETDIISRIAGGDMTKGSCSSLAFAYAGNKAGLDVLDFRGGISQHVFSQGNTICEIAEKVGGVIAKNTNDFVKAVELLKNVIEGKEYYFTCGSHASVVRKVGNIYEYLELQSNFENGFKELTNSVLKKRFGAKRSHTMYRRKYETRDCIIDIDLLKNDTGFKQLLGYLNTASGNQKKGALGAIK